MKLRQIQLLFLFIIISNITLSGQWIIKDFNVESGFTGMHFANENVGYAVAQTGLYKTTDSGDTWEIFNPFASAFLLDVFLTDKDNIFLAGRNLSNPTVVKSEDGGETWINYQLAATSPISSLSFPSSDVGYCCSTGGELFRSDNAGHFWNLQKEIPGFEFHDIHFFDELRGMTIGSNDEESILVKTINGGMSWSQKILPYPQLQSVFVVSEEKAYICGLDNSVLKTENFGSDWEDISFGEVGMIDHFDAFFLDENIGYLAGNNAVKTTVFKTTDGGVTWEEIGPNRPESLFTIHFIDTELGFAAGGPNGLIIKTTNAVSNTEVLNEQDLSIYPNPFEDEITIQLKNNNETIHSISLYTITGELVLNRKVDHASDLSIDLGRLNTTTTYLLTINTDDHTYIKKIVKENR